MSRFFSVSITFLNAAFHGRGEGGEPEWPPSPLRVFQALTATAGAFWKGDEFTQRATVPLSWLERLSAPEIVAPAGRRAAAYQLFVPNNAMDLVAAAWSRGNTTGKDAQAATHRASKTVRPTAVPEGSRVTYLWPLSGDPSPEELAHLEVLTVLARGAVAVGWGIDLVAAHARVITGEEAAELPGLRWTPVADIASTNSSVLPTQSGSGTTLRVPRQGTFTALVTRHGQFLNRLSGTAFSAVPALSPGAYERRGYQREDMPMPRAVAAFQFLQPDASGYRIFDLRKGTTAVAMMRHATAEAARESGWADERVNRFILGHAEASGAEHKPVGANRFAFLPVPTIEPRQRRLAVVSDIRRLLLTVPSGPGEAEIAWAKQRLSGRLLTPHGSTIPAALVSVIPRGDRQLEPYLRAASVWASVTPVILPGHDDRHARKVETLIRKAILHAGYSELLARNAHLSWQSVGVWQGAEVVSRYQVPEHLRNLPRHHVRIAWRDGSGDPVAVPGPVCLGGGRYYGLGLFAGLPEQ